VHAASVFVAWIYHLRRVAWWSKLDDSPLVSDSRSTPDRGADLSGLNAAM
jgi:hypothetical protein